MASAWSSFVTAYNRDGIDYRISQQPLAQAEELQRTFSVICIIGAGGFDRATGIATGGYSTSAHFEYNDIEIPANVVPLLLPMPPGSEIVTGIYLQYNMIKNGHEVPINKPTFMPAGIVSAMFIGE